MAKSRLTSPRLVGARFPTARALEILGQLGERLQETEIASRLFVSRETIEFHLKRIYRKLSVHGRRDAVREGRKLGLLSDVETRVRH